MLFEGSKAIEFGSIVLIPKICLNWRICWGMIVEVAYIMGLWAICITSYLNNKISNLNQSYALWASWYALYKVSFGSFLFELLLQSLSHGLDELEGVQVWASWDIVFIMDADCQIFGHFSILNSFNSSFFEFFTEVFQLWEFIEVGSVKETSWPGKDRSDRVGWGFFSFLMLTIVTSHGSVGSFGLNSTIGSEEHWSH